MVATGPVKLSITTDGYHPSWDFSETIKLMSNAQNQNQIIGQAMYNVNLAKKNCFVIDLNIKEPFRRKGYGSRVLDEVLKRVVDIYELKDIYITPVPYEINQDKNPQEYNLALAILEKLYKSKGFEKIDEDSLAMKLRL